MLYLNFVINTSQACKKWKFHINIVKAGMSDADWKEMLPEAIKELFRLTVALGGTISGEHGMGLVQKPYIDIALGEKQLELMRGIKMLFDPNGNLNPGKIF